MSPAQTRAPPLFKSEALWAFVFALALQTAGAFLWAGAASARLDALERRSATIEEMIERTARLEEQNAAMRAVLVRIEAKLDRLGTDEGGE